MKDCSAILEALEKRIEGIPQESVVKLSELVGKHKEREIVAAAKMLLKKYGIQYK